MKMKSNFKPHLKRLNTQVRNSNTLKEIKENIGSLLQEPEKPSFKEKFFSQNILSDDTVQPFCTKLAFPDPKSAQISNIFEKTEAIIMSYVMKYAIAAENRALI